VKVDRRGRIDQPEMVECPSLSVVGGIQHDLLSSLRDAAGDDGFLDRLLWADPDPVPWRWTEDDVSSEASYAVIRLFELLNGLEYDPGDYNEQWPFEVHFDAEAKERWIRWYEALGVEANGVAPYLRGVWNKLPGQLARIVLIVHAIATVREKGKPGIGSGATDASCCSAVASSVPLATLEAAITLIEYFKHHARRVYGRIYRKRVGRGADEGGPEPEGGPTDLLAVKVLNWLRTHGRTSKRDLLHEALGGHVKAGQLDGVLEALEEAGEIVCEEVRGSGRPTTFYRLAEVGQSDSAA